MVTYRGHVIVRRDPENLEASTIYGFSRKAVETGWKQRERQGQPRYVEWSLHRQKLTCYRFFMYSPVEENGTIRTLGWLDTQYPPPIKLSQQATFLGDNDRNNGHSETSVELAGAISIRTATDHIWNRRREKILSQKVRSPSANTLYCYWTYWTVLRSRIRAFYLARTRSTFLCRVFPWSQKNTK